MSTPEPAVPVDSLLAHQDFVRALARNLVGDVSSADDVVQDTWLAALRSPPRDGHSLRSWLAAVVRSRAQNTRRGHARRQVREELAACSEVDESDASLRRQVELSQDIVRVVLALDEPYRSVVLQRYYEDLSPTEIARRRGVAAGTIRSQLSRGHELLRERLDRQYGDRRAWCVMLVPLIDRGATKSLTLSTTLWFVTAVATVAVLAPISWRAATAKTTYPPNVAPPPEILGSADASFVLELSTAEPSRSRVALPAAKAPAIDSQASAHASAGPSASADLSAMSARELVERMVQVQRLLEQRVLINGREWPPSLTTLKEDSEAGIFWIVPRDRFDFESANPFGLRGGGAYYSFVTRSHSYDREPDIELTAEGMFNSTAMGPAFLVSLGKLDLLRVPASASATIDAAGPRVNDAWNALWTEPDVVQKHAARLELQPSARAAVGETYVLRRLSRNDHDVLAAFTVLEERDHAMRIAFRVLKTWPVVDQHAAATGTGFESSIGAPPAWVDAMSVERLLVLADEVRAQSKLVLFGIPEPLRERDAASTGAQNSGVVRVLEGGRFDRVVMARGGGSFWSFATRDHDYNREPDIALQDGRLSSGFYGASTGMVLDLGTVRIGDVSVQRDSPPPTLSAIHRKAWELMWTVTPHAWPRDGQIVVALDEEQRKQADELGVLHGTKAQAGHSYLVRSVLPDEHDLIAAFEIVGRDENGITIAWRLLATFPIPKKP